MRNKTVVIHQPDFLPYCGFFHRFLKADLYIILDHVQFVHGSRGWTHRDKIKTAAGAKWVTVSVEKAPRATPINQIRIAKNTNWKEDNLQLIKENYQSTDFYEQIYPAIESLYSFQSNSLSEFNLQSIQMLMKMFDIELPCVMSSDLNATSAKSDLILDLLIESGATHYLSGIGARAYLDQSLLVNAGIEIIWQEFQHPVYPQQYGSFIPGMSSIDMLFNCGVEQSQVLLRGS